MAYSHQGRAASHDGSGGNGGMYTSGGLYYGPQSSARGYGQPDANPYASSAPSLNASSPAFVPSGSQLSSSAAEFNPYSNNNPGLNTSSPEFVPTSVVPRFGPSHSSASARSFSHPHAYTSSQGHGYGHHSRSNASGSGTMGGGSGLSHSMTAPASTDYLTSKMASMGVHSRMRMMQQHEYLEPKTHEMPYVYTLPFTPTHLQPDKRSSRSLFMQEELRKQFITQQLTTENQVSFDPSVPVEVDNYHSLVPLEPTATPSAQVLPYPSTIYKAFSNEDGRPYALRRIRGFQLTERKAMRCVDAWRKVQHPNVVALREVFTCKDFGDQSLVFVYDYYPCSTTLFARHLQSLQPKPIAEPLLWSYIIQLTSAIRAVHASSLAVRVVDASKIILYGRNKLLIGSTCIFDVLEFDEDMSPAKMLQHQQNDLMQLGNLLLALACSSMPVPVSTQTMQQSLQYVRATFSEDVFRVIGYLLSVPGMAPQGVAKSVHDLMPMIGARFYNEIERQQGYASMLESELSKEIQSSRLFRLMSKLMFVTDRPEANSDPRWAETGDRYLLKLLKSYIFHQVAEDGSSFLDLSHVVQCLNKLDAGSSEKIMLMSPDGQNVMVVSYRDLARCLKTAFDELVGRQQAT